MASRINYNIRERIRYIPFNKKLKVLFSIIKEGIKWKYTRKLIIKDNIITPFNKLVTCKIKPHIFIKSEDGDYCWCEKCNKVIVTKDYDKYIRSQKIKKLIRKTKKRKKKL